MSMRYTKPINKPPRPDKQTELQRLAYQQKADQRQSFKNSLATKPPAFRQPSRRR